MTRRILITDFDGTLSRVDFYQLAFDTHLPADAIEFWTLYEQGRITHFEALQRMFASLRGTEDELLATARKMQIPHDLAMLEARLREAGWEWAIASAGCRWYIERLLGEVGVAPTVFANPGRYVRGEGLRMERDRSAWYDSDETGVDKARVVAHFQALGYVVAYAGDGRPDLPPILSVPAPLRFAKGWLARNLADRNESFHLFADWSEIVAHLTSSAAPQPVS